MSGLINLKPFENAEDLYDYYNEFRLDHVTYTLNNIESESFQLQRMDTSELVAWCLILTHQITKLEKETAELRKQLNEQNKRTN